MCVSGGNGTRSPNSSSCNASVHTPISTRSCWTMWTRTRNCSQYSPTSSASKESSAHRKSGTRPAYTSTRSHTRPHANMTARARSYRCDLVQWKVTSQRRFLSEAIEAASVKFKCGARNREPPPPPISSHTCASNTRHSCLFTTSAMSMSSTAGSNGNMSACITQT
eukprot:1418939-Rhodomonas_salina.2